MVKVNCAAIPGTLIESELFGRERGAYTGALTSQIGRFELANGSTIFSTRLATCYRNADAKLLRVIENRESNGSALHGPSRGRTHHRGHEQGPQPGRS